MSTISGMGENTRYRIINGKKVYLIKVPATSGPGYTWEVPRKEGPMRKPKSYR